MKRFLGFLLVAVAVLLLSSPFAFADDTDLAALRAEIVSIVRVSSNDNPQDVAVRLEAILPEAEKLQDTIEGSNFVKELVELIALHDA